MYRKSSAGDHRTQNLVWMALRCNPIRKNTPKITKNTLKYSKMLMKRDAASKRPALADFAGSLLILRASKLTVHPVRKRISADFTDFITHDSWQYQHDYSTAS